MNGFRIDWAPLATPRVPSAAVTFGDVARRLVQKLLMRDEEALESLRIAAGPAAVVLIGDAPHLPWCDGVSYVGRDVRAPTLYLPTHSEPRVPVDLLAAAIHSRVSSHNVVICQTPAALLAIETTQVLRREVLEHWLEEH